MNDSRGSLAAVVAVAISFAVGAAPARAAERSLDPIFDVQRTNDIKYGEAFNSRTNSVQELRLDLDQPAADTSNARPPNSRSSVSSLPLPRLARIDRRPLKDSAPSPAAVAAASPR